MTLGTDFSNVYEDDTRAAAYARLQLPGTYYLAYRDLPEIIATQVPGGAALDFGCGTGRSTRFLRDLGFAATGVDIAGSMISHARRLDPDGDYRLVGEGDLGELADHSFDLALSLFTFDNIPTLQAKLGCFRELARVTRPGGVIINLVSSPEMYWNEWLSFSTRDFPENREAQSGDEVRIIVTDVDDSRPVVDVLWTDEAYREVFDRAGLRVVAVHRPLGRADEPYAWITEAEVPPWVIYVLRTGPVGLSTPGLSVPRC